MKLTRLDFWKASPRWTIVPGERVRFSGGGPEYVDRDGQRHRYTLSGTVEDPRLRDVYIFVNDQKVYFAPGAKTGAPGPVKFSADFPLKEGSNHVVVVAREDDDLASRRAFTVLRRPTEIADKTPARPHQTGTP